MSKWHRAFLLRNPRTGISEGAFFWYGLFHPRKWMRLTTLHARYLSRRCR